MSVDLSLYRPVQPHFTARSIFENGAIDPILNRSGIDAGGSGLDAVTVPDDLDEFVAIDTTNLCYLLVRK